MVLHYVCRDNVNGWRFPQICMVQRIVTKLDQMWYNAWSTVDPITIFVLYILIYIIYDSIHSNKYFPAKHIFKFQTRELQKCFYMRTELGKFR